MCVSVREHQGSPPGCIRAPAVDGTDGKCGGGKGIGGRLQRGWLRGVYSLCFGPAESRTKEKRVRSLSVRDEQRVPNDHDDNDGSFVREFLFLACHTDPHRTLAPVLDF